MSALQLAQARATAKRDRLIRRQRSQGWTLARIAAAHGITKQRVHQIVNRTEGT